MQKLEFVRIKSKIKGFGIGKGTKYIFDDCRNIIKEKIEEGWIYNGFVPVVQRGTGDVEQIDLIFTKKVNKLD